jgi:hypothetical protein
VPTKRSAIAFARGARTGVLTILMSTAVKTALKLAVNLLSAGPAQLRGQQLAQRAEDRPVDPGQCRTWVVSTQHGDLVTQHQDLNVLCCVGPGEQRQPAQHASEDQVRKSEGHGRRSCRVGVGR